MIPRILELEANGKTLRQRLEFYWQGIAPEIRVQLVESMVALNVDKQYNAAELDSLWHDKPQTLKQALNYGLLIQTDKQLQAHRLLWAYLNT